MKKNPFRRLAKNIQRTLSGNPRLTLEKKQAHRSVLGAELEANYQLREELATRLEAASGDTAKEIIRTELEKAKRAWQRLKEKERRMNVNGQKRR